MTHPRWISFSRCGLLALTFVVLFGAGRWSLKLGGWDRFEPTKTIASPIALEPQVNDAPRLNFSGGVAWLNTAGPINADALRGKVVLLDFWTFCCINCHHVLPDLAKLEKKYGSSLVVIGVHTAKFDAEKVTANIRQKVREYGVKHPVVNDADQLIWRRFDVRSWPTLAVFDTKGYLVGGVGGEGNYEILDREIGKLVRAAKAKGELDESPIDFHLEDEKVDSDPPLRFPGKILADGANDRLFISDTGHNRIVITTLNGETKEIVGSGATGLKDGSYEQAQFNRQQGMCLLDDVLYVADVENHAIRAVNLKTKKVETIAGNGTQGHRRSGTTSTKTATLNSPWDVIPVPGSKTLLIAMAGPHQIWKLDLESKMVGVWAGDGSEDIADGTIARSSFAQPSGLATDGSSLFVADSEGSCVRSITLGKTHTVRTLAGAHDVPNVLFSFGDHDGRGSEVRLQHCLGLAFGGGKLYIADTYNNKIKVCNVATGAVETLAGADAPKASGDADAKGDAKSTGDPTPLFFQPGGLSVAGDKLYVAATNNDAIRVVDLKTRKISTLELANLKPPTPPRQPPKFFRAKETKLAESKVAPGKEVVLEVALELPKGFKLNDEKAMPYLLETPGQASVLSPDVPDYGGRIEKPTVKFTVNVPFAHALKAGDHVDLKFSLATFICKYGAEGVCKPENFVWTIPLAVAEGGATSVPVTNTP
jgi:thiol-disulfide isomerase/thioredoxin